MRKPTKVTSRNGILENSTWPCVEAMEPRLLLAAMPLVSVEATTPQAAEAGLVAGTFTVSVDSPQPTDLPVSMWFSGSAKLGRNFTAPFMNPVVIPAGETSIAVNITPLDDGVPTGDLSILANLRPTFKYNLGVNKTATIDFVDSEPKVSIAAGDASISERAGEHHSTVVTVTSDTPAPVGGMPVNVVFNGTAINNKHYVVTGLTDNSVTIPEGETTATFTIIASDDGIVTGDVNVTVSVQCNRVCGPTAPKSATVAIVDGDPKVTIAAADASITEQPGEHHSTLFTVTSNVAAPDGGMRVQVYLSGAANNRKQYTVTGLLGNYVTIAAGDTTASFIMTARDDGGVTGDVAATASLRSTRLYGAGAPASAAVLTVSAAELRSRGRKLLR
ncbi:MAG: Calx-beta domain-containing protein, partial [Planctomycetota bacterium]